MLRRQLSRKLVMTAGLVVAMGAFGASQSSAEQARSRSSVSSKSPQSSSNSGRSATVRSNSGNSGRSATARSHSGSRRSRGAGVTRSGGGRRDGYNGGRHSHRGYRYGYGLGYYGRYGAFWGGYGGYYYNPFYWGYPLYYSYQPRRYSEFGALDLNVRPKKTEVWVDGQYVGTTGRFDGYPGHLWLGDGRHELIFYNQGFETVRREVKVLEGVVLDIHHQMVPGASVPVEELTAFTREELGKRDEERAYREPREPREPQRPSAKRGPVREDVREEPGRLKLEIAPADASIYLDGRFLGSGQELVRLHSGLMVSPGEHTLEVVRPGFDSEEIPFSVEPGEETELRVELEEARV